MRVVEADGTETMNAATVVLLRRRLPHNSNSMTSSSPHKRHSCDWQVLLGQNMVQNWLRSTPDHPVVMRYPGEWKFPGGVQDHEDINMRATALRELQEEFCGIRVPNEVSASSALPFPSPLVRLYAISKKLTRPIGGRRFWMHNFVATMEENSWIPDNVEDIVNENLTKRLETFQLKLSDNTYWNLSESMKMEVSPELRRVKWMHIDEAISILESAHLDPSSCVDEWQREEFSILGITARDPMYQSMVILKEVRALGTVENFRRQQEVHNDW